MYSIPSDDELDFVEVGADTEAKKFQLFEKHLEKLKGRNEKALKAETPSAVNNTNLKLSSHESGTSIENDSTKKPASASAPTVTSEPTDSVEPKAHPIVVQNPTKPTTSGGAGYRILVNKKQKGNPVLKFIRNVPWEYDTIIPDYELGQCNCALYLSLKYHNRFPEYIHSRLKELGKRYELRILLVQVDTRYLICLSPLRAAKLASDRNNIAKQKQQDVSHELNQLAKICMLADCTLILAFSYEEAGRYLEIYKAYEHKQPTEIMGKTSTDFISQANDCLTSIKGINKTDVTTLLSRFKTMKNIMAADIDTLGLCPGIGPLKARRLHAAFQTPFLKHKKQIKQSETTTVGSGETTTAANIETKDDDNEMIHDSF